MLNRPTITDSQKRMIESLLRKHINQINSEVSDTKQLLNLFWTILFDKDQIIDVISTIMCPLEMDGILLDASMNISDLYEGQSNAVIKLLDNTPLKLSDSDIKFTIAFLIYDEMKALIAKEIMLSYTKPDYSFQEGKWLSRQLSTLSLFEVQDPPINRPKQPLLKFNNMHQALLTFEKDMLETMSPKQKQDSDWEMLSEDGLDDPDEISYQQARTFR